MIIAACGSDSGDASLDASTDRGVIIQPPDQDDPIVDPATLRPIVITGVDYACAILEDRSVRCWGSNADGQLGNPQIADLPDGGYTFDSRPVAFPQRAAITEVGTLSSGGLVFPPFGTDVQTGCAVRSDKHVHCWGSDESAALGRGSASEDANLSKRPHPEPQPVTGLPPSEQVVTSGYFSCALSTLAVRCWGGNDDDNKWSANSPKKVTSPVEIALPSRRSAKQLAIGTSHICALLDDAHVACWGSNLSGQLGTSAASPNPTPTVVPGIENVVELKAASGITCVRTVAGEVQCWGANGNGRLGRGPMDASQSSTPAPVALPEGSRARQISVGEHHVCAILQDRTVWCWGNNELGGLGSGNTDGKTMVPSESSIPIAVQGLPTGALYVSVGGGFTCATLADYSVTCWGSNRFGTLGRGTIDTSPHPEPARVNF
ncbi:RCC1 domain-containing protein [Pendulispora rubella]|uniref:RCC1 domain-containing protein n=1 Tax=Pendulispora rubella TaxID=2741070 RepID=UPI00374E0E67